MAYADYYERALTNGVLSIQRGKEPGIMLYILPMARGSSKAISYHKWGIKSFLKLGDSIHFEEAGNAQSLYIIQYISSSLNWKSGKVFLHQKVEPMVSWDLRLQVTM
ncbi:hypothetical protein CTI12_AA277540 [Artemisia annua]|uniref:Non-reducing end beta-L-arabinofuranosidase-like GH127 catalytic domain-containing protein n=1 Tax=Artemisia annua TaxID=35608 RepID=A0A2U1NDZ1_ARTAN|nr:hypothetical protein CTI12_AA277540 [Artemisia annua]